MKSNKIILIVVIVLAAAVCYFIYTYTTGTIKHELRDFAVKDTASINKIFLADRKGNKSLLTKVSPGNWMLNDKYPAANLMVNTLLTTMAKMEVRSPAGKAAYNTVMRDLITEGVKVEIYQNNELTKTIYVGGPTQDMYGTFMYLQNSSVPFVIHIPGFDGYLTPRFVTTPQLWRSKVIFNYGDNDIKRIAVYDLMDSTRSFRLVRNGEEYDFFVPANATTTTPLLKSMQAAYIEKFSKIGYEYEDYGLHKNIKDSILKVNQPIRRLEVEDVRGYITNITMYKKTVIEGTLTSLDPRTGRTRPFDIDRMFAKINGDTNFVVIQYQMFDPIFRRPDSIRMK